MKAVLIITIVIILFSSTFIINSAFAQSYTGVLKLDPIPSNVKAGGIITFSGTLTTTDGRVVQEATIYIKDDVDFDIDTVLGTVTTDKNGKFSADWKTVTRISGSYDFYAVYEGGGNISSSRSVTHTVNVLSSGSSSYSTSTSYTPTKITLDRFINSAKTGEIVTFSGKLTANGKGLANAVVNIKDEDFADLNDFLATVTTDSTGKFSVKWKVKNVDSGDRKFSSLIADLYGGFGGVTQLNHIYNIAEANTVEVYVEFKGNNQYSKSNTCLIENVDGVLQENCNNRILLIQDDSSFENLIMSTVLSEMGITTSGAESLESILSNQADFTDAANFEDFLLEALQDELDLGNTDLSMQEMLELLENPSLAGNYNTVPSYTPPNISKLPPKATTNLDSDGDGIPDYRDECIYIKENYNGYKDTDGCLDIKLTTISPIITTPLIETYNPQFDIVSAAKVKQEREAREQQQKLLLQEAQFLQKQSYKNLKVLKNDILISEESLKQLTSTSDEERKIIDNAWSLLKNSKEKLGKIEDRYRDGDKHIGFKLFTNAKMYYTLNPNDGQDIGYNLKEISKSIDLVKELQMKTCFLFWCW